eukprot:COSAG01_NODE_47989_length_385_cov_0.716783_2_plen_58_part_01
MADYRGVDTLGSKPVRPEPLISIHLPSLCCEHTCEASEVGVPSGSCPCRWLEPQFERI